MRHRRRHNLPRREALKRAHLWGPGVRARATRASGSISTWYSNTFCRISKPVARSLIEKAEMQSVPHKDWEFTFGSVGMKNLASYADAQWVQQGSGRTRRKAV